LLRYQAQTERHYRRAVEEFDRLKALRQEMPDEPIETQPEQTAPTCTVDETNPNSPEEPQNAGFAHAVPPEPELNPVISPAALQDPEVETRHPASAAVPPIASRVIAGEPCNPPDTEDTPLAESR
jgi:hypothetical protein